MYKKITVPVTFPVYPPSGGGQERLYQLYKNIAIKYKVEFVTYCSTQPSVTEINKNLVEIATPQSEQHLKEYWKMQEKYKGPIADIAMMWLSKYTPDYGKNLEHSINTSDIVILSHPFLFNEMSNYLGNKPFIYEAQDVEYLVKAAVLQNDINATGVLQAVFDIEKQCCDKSLLILTCSEEDKQKLVELYDVSSQKIVVVPNGVDTSKTKFTSLSTRLIYKKQLGISKEKTALFMGSDHPPNIDACNLIIKMANKTPNVKYLLMGSQCNYFLNNSISLPKNVGLLGVVDDVAKQRIFDIVDIALNPITSGSGTNLKMFDYMAAGIPVLTTLFGSRGIADKSVFYVSDIENMAPFIDQFDISNANNIIFHARKYVEEIFDWRKIAENLLPYIDQILN